MDNKINISVLTVFCEESQSLDQYVVGQSELCIVKKEACALILTQVCVCFLTDLSNETTLNFFFLKSKGIMIKNIFKIFLYNTIVVWMCWFSSLVRGKRGWELSEDCFSNFTHKSWLTMGTNFHFYSDTLTGIVKFCHGRSSSGKWSFCVRKGEVNCTYIGGSFCFGKQWQAL